MRRGLRRGLASLRLAASYLSASLRRDRRAFLIGVAAVALVAAFAAVLQSALEASPVVFLKYSEDTAGETDLQLVAEVSGDAASPLPFLLDFTATSAALTASRCAQVRGLAPRWLAPAHIAAKGRAAVATSAFVIALDTRLEASIGLGRAWSHRPLGEGECHASAGALRELGVTPGAGERIVLSLSAAQAFAALAGGGFNGGGGSSGRNATAAANEDFARRFLLPAILTAAGLTPAEFDASSADLTLPSLAALQAAMLAAGLPLSALNVSQAFSQTPPDVLARGLVRVPLAPIALAALDEAAGGGGGDGLAQMTAEFAVVDGLDSPQGKWPALLGNVVVLEAKFLAPLLAVPVITALDRLVVLLAAARLAGGGVARLAVATDQLRASAASFDYASLQHYAMSASVMWAGRDWYITRTAQAGGDPFSDPSGIVGFSNAVLTSLGESYPVRASMPLAQVLEGPGFRIFSLFLEQILHVSIFVLTMLSVLVVYTLVLGDVEAKTYELGMLRALGLPHLTLAELLAMQTAAFALPGLALGLALAALINVIGLSWLGTYAHLSLPLGLSGNALDFALVIGLLTPVLAVVLPVRRALAGSLRDALDPYRSAAAAVPFVKVERLASLGLDPAQTAAALLLIVAGVVIYYLLPLSFLLRDLSFFLAVLTGILMAMLLGLAVAGLALLPKVEEPVLALLLGLACDLRLWVVVRKNLAGHRARNRKSSAMVGLAATFLAFAGCAFELQARSLKANVRLLLGSDIVAIVLDSSAASSALPQEALQLFLDNDAARGPGQANVAAYSFVSAPLTAFRFVRRTLLSPLAGLPRLLPNVYGVQANLLDVAFRDLTIVTRWSASGLDNGNLSFASVDPSSDPVRALYAGAGLEVLPVEATLAQPPAPVATGEVLPPPAYACVGASGAPSPGALGGGSWWLSHVNAPWPEDLQPAGNGTSAPRDALGSVLNATLQWVGTEAAEAWRGGLRVSPDNVTLPALWRVVNAQLSGGLAASPTDASSLAVVFSDPSACMLLCNADTISQASQRTGAGRGACLPAEPTLAPFWGPGSAFADLEGPMPPAISSYVNGAAFSLANATLSAACWLPHSCAALPATSLAARAASVASSYGAYVDSIASESLNAAAAVTPASPLQLRIVTRDASSGLVAARALLVKARAMVRKLSPWFFSSYAPTATRAPLLVRMQDYARILDASLADLSALRAEASGGGPAPAPPAPVSPPSGGDDSAPDVPKFRLLVKLTPDAAASDDRRQYVVNSLRSAIASDAAHVEDTASVLASTDVAVDGLNLFFGFTAGLCLVLTFFASWLSFSANVRESAHEFAVLRSMLPAWAVARCFVYEALTVTLTACLVGFAVGLAVATSLSLQLSVFIENAFLVVLPTALLASFIAAVAGVAMAASFEPARILMRASIASLLKGRGEQLQQG